MTASTRYMAPPHDYHSRTVELLDLPWIDFVAFVVYPALVVLALAAACVLAIVRMRRRRREPSHG
ncbi:MAG: hypothetical protein OXN81_11230 [Alphaproteobacteria bacterium]|nr:hypothetical protein [Alphaproteobacteria bacterium]